MSDISLAVIRLIPTIFLIESFWKPNFWVGFRKVSSISSLDSGTSRLVDRAGYASRVPPKSRAVQSKIPMRGAVSDSDEGS